MKKAHFIIYDQSGKKIIKRITVKNTDPEILDFLKNLSWALPIISPCIFIISFLNVVLYYQFFGIDILDYISISDVLIKSIENIGTFFFCFLPFIPIARIAAPRALTYVALRINGDKVKVGLRTIISAIIGFLGVAFSYAIVSYMFFSERVVLSILSAYAATLVSYYGIIYVCGKFKTPISSRTLRLESVCTLKVSRSFSYAGSLKRCF